MMKVSSSASQEKAYVRGLRGLRLGDELDSLPPEFGSFSLAVGFVEPSGPSWGLTRVMVTCAVADFVVSSWLVATMFMTFAVGTARGAV
jgi:hypothetical protein